MQQLVIFDLDGTLIDSRMDLTEAINHMRGTYQLPPLSMQTVSGFIGNGARALLERSLAGTSVDVDEAFERNKEYYLSHLTVHTTCYPGVLEGIKTLAKNGHKMAVLTNKPGKSSRLILDHFGVSADLGGEYWRRRYKRVKTRSRRCFSLHEKSGNL